MGAWAINKVVLSIKPMLQNNNNKIFFFSFHQIHKVMITLYIMKTKPSYTFQHYGPYKVLKNIGTMAYKLVLPASSQVHPIFPCFMVKEGYEWQATSSNNKAKTWQGRKNHIGAWRSHRNKNSITTKSINFRVSH